MVTESFRNGSGLSPTSLFFRRVCASQTDHCRFHPPLRRLTNRSNQQRWPRVTTRSPPRRLPPPLRPPLPPPRPPRLVSFSPQVASSEARATRSLRRPPALLVRAALPPPPPIPSSCVLLSQCALSSSGGEGGVLFVGRRSPPSATIAVFVPPSRRRPPPPPSSRARVCVRVRVGVSQCLVGVVLRTLVGCALGARPLGKRRWGVCLGGVLVLGFTFTPCAPPHSHTYSSPGALSDTTSFPPPHQPLSLSPPLSYLTYLFSALNRS